MTTLALAPPVPIEPGDVLCYSGSGLFSTLIRLKTWAPKPLGISHVELANSGASAFASRDWRGVQTYAIDLDPKRLVAILRPRMPLAMDGVRHFHAHGTDEQHQPEQVSHRERPHVDLRGMGPGSWVQGPHREHQNRQRMVTRRRGVCPGRGGPEAKEAGKVTARRRVRNLGHGDLLRDPDGIRQWAAQGWLDYLASDRPTPPSTGD